MSKKVDIVSEKIIFDDFFKIKEAEFTHEKYDGSVSPVTRRLSFERNDSVAAVVYNRITKKLILTEQFRYPTYEKGPGWLLELVAGSLKLGEDPKLGMIREIEEELGYVPVHIEEINTFYVSPGGSSERIILFYAEVENKISAGGGLASENEDIKIVEFMAGERIENIQDAKTFIGLAWFYAQKIMNC